MTLRRSAWFAALVLLAWSLAAGPGCGGSRRSRSGMDAADGDAGPASHDTSALPDSEPDTGSPDTGSPDSTSIDGRDGSVVPDADAGESDRDGGRGDGGPGDAADTPGPRDGAGAEGHGPDADGSDPDDARDTTVPPDAPDPGDVGVPDAGLRDAHAADSGSADAQDRDSVPIPDAPIPDAPIPDAWSPDGSLPDSLSGDSQPLADGAGRQDLPPPADAGAELDGAADSAAPADAVAAPCFSHAFCDDGDPCNGLEYCDVQTARCAPGTPRICETDRCIGLERCEPFVGCVPVESEARLPFCLDDDPCNGWEACDPVLAAAGDPAACGPGEPLDCDDGRFCNGAETCVTGQGCRPGPAPQCDPGDPLDPCDGAWGCDDQQGCSAVHGPLVCDDGDACNGQETCVAGEGCRTVVPAPECDDGDVCNGSETCAPATGECLPGTPLPCVDDNPCTTDGCDPEAGGCVFPLRTGACDDGDPCTLDDACAAGVCTGHPTCLCPADDEWEDDDGPAQAIAVPLPGDRDAEVLHEDRVVCGWDEDWSIVTVAAGDHLELAVRHDPAYGEIVLWVQDEQGEVLTWAGGQEAADGLTLDAAADGPLFLAVTGDGTAGFENVYTLRVYHIPGGYCVDDALEPNDHWLYAKPLGWGPDGHPAAPFDGRLCPDDEDWFVTTLAEGQTLVADLAFDPPEAALGLEVITDFGHRRARGAGAPGLVRASYVAEEDADYLLRLRGTPGAAADYTLTLTATSAPGCVDDLLEGNDTRADAAEVPGPSSQSALVACPGDEDWYQLTPGGGDVARGVLTQDPQDPPLGCELWTAAGRLRACDAHPTGGAFVEDGAAGPLYLRVTGAGAAPIPYGLALRVDPPSACPDDPFEAAGRVADQAVIFPLVPGGATDSRAGTIEAVSCPGNGDIYAIDLDYQEAFVADLVFDPGTADLDLVLVGPDGREVRRSQTDAGHEQVSYRADGIGTYHLIVPAGAAGADYTLSVRVDPTWTCTADPFEPNDSRTDPLPPLLADGVTVSGQACAGENDYFAVDLVPGQVLVLALRAWLRDGDLDLMLYDPTGRTVSVARTPMDGEHVVYEATTAGRHTFRVMGLTNGNVYGLAVRVLDGLPACADDGLEPNDAPSGARVLPLVDDAAAVDGVLCPFDEDWYAVDLAEGNTLAADLSADGGDLANLDVRCAGPDGVPLGALTRSSGGGHVFCVARQAGRHTLRVLRPLDPDGEAVSYRLNLLREAECSSPPNLISIPRTFVVQTIRGTLCPDLYARGRYSVWLRAGETLAARLDAQSPPGHVRDCACTDDYYLCGLFICDVDAPSRTGFVDSGSDGASLQAAAFRQGGHELNLMRREVTIDHDYFLDVTILPSPCADDPYEPTTYNSAGPPRTMIPSDQPFSGHLCPRDEDRYLVTVPSSKKLTEVRLEFVNARGNLDLASPGTGAAGDADVEVLHPLVGWGADPTIVIYGRTRFDENDYTLRFTLIDAP